MFRHSPLEPGLRKVLPWLAVERPEVFNAYQQTQRERVEKALMRASFVASFIGHEPGKAVFVGLYTVGSSRPLTPVQYAAVPEHKVLRSFGQESFAGTKERPTVLFFDLVQTEFYAPWRGRLVVNWPPPERAWWRWASQNEIPVNAVLEESALSAAMPRWDQIVLAWRDLTYLPSRWKLALAEWRGIYFIFDTSDGKGYVGSAYGAENLLGRWAQYAESGHGGNKLLRERRPDDLQFSILQRVSPDMDGTEVIQLEATWKDRLHTRSPCGLNDN